MHDAHATPSPALQHARHQYRGLDNEGARADEVRLLFLVTDVLIGSFRPQLLAIDDRLGEIQLGMLRGASVAPGRTRQRRAISPGHRREHGHDLGLDRSWARIRVRAAAPSVSPFAQPDQRKPATA